MVARNVPSVGANSFSSLGGVCVGAHLICGRDLQPLWCSSTHQEGNYQVARSGVDKRICSRVRPPAVEICTNYQGGKLLLWPVQLGRRWLGRIQLCVPRLITSGSSDACGEPLFTAAAIYQETPVQKIQTSAAIIFAALRKGESRCAHAHLHILMRVRRMPVFQRSWWQSQPCLWGDNKQWRRGVSVTCKLKVKVCRKWIFM